MAPKSLEHLNGNLACHFEEWISANGHKVEENHTKVISIHDSMKDITSHTENLSMLPQIANEMRLMRYIVIILTLTLCTLLVLRELGNRNFHLTPTGVRIESK